MEVAEINRCDGTFLSGDASRPNRGSDPLRLPQAAPPFSAIDLQQSSFQGVKPRRVTEVKTGYSPELLHFQCHPEWCAKGKAIPPVILSGVPEAKPSPPVILSGVPEARCEGSGRGTGTCRAGNGRYGKEEALASPSQILRRLRLLRMTVEGKALAPQDDTSPRHPEPKAKDLASSQRTAIASRRGKQRNVRITRNVENLSANVRVGDGVTYPDVCLPRFSPARPGGFAQGSQYRCVVDLLQFCGC